MGRDKTLLPYKNHPSLTHFLFDKMSKNFQNVFVCAKEQKFQPNLPLIKDKFMDFSPMLALYSALSNFQNKNVFIITADSPFIEISTIEILNQNLQGFDICVAKDDENLHSLCGFYNSNLSDIAKNLYENSNHKIGALFKFAKFKSINFDNKEQFLNINYPKDYENLIKKGQ
ncbi:NTP transferase domain-containing protein [Campylobacter sp. FMV-PI01]|uniref:NTP transferase domain-containing protein n=2 Tax=Campylobacter portucalensis TaxID=2608384 RepID=A0A6L5WFR2_9BACT|nr:NTP transferase domain-containing protein [Campylobacter portucalensis]